MKQDWINAAQSEAQRCINYLMLDKYTINLAYYKNKKHTFLAFKRRNAHHLKCKLLYIQIKPGCLSTNVFYFSTQIQLFF